MTVICERTRKLSFNGLGQLFVVTYSDLGLIPTVTDFNNLDDLERHVNELNQQL